MPAPAGGARWLTQTCCGWCCEEAHQAVEGGDRSGQEVVGSACLYAPTAVFIHLPSTFPLQNPGLVEQYLSAILSLEPNQSYAGMLGLLVHFCTSHKEIDVVSRHKASTRHGGDGSAKL